MSSSVESSRRLREFILLCADPHRHLDRNVRCTLLRTSMFPSRFVSRTKVADLGINASFTWGLPLGPRMEMFRSNASRLIPSIPEPLPTTWEIVSFAGAAVLPPLVEVPADEIGVVPVSRSAQSSGPQQLGHRRLDQLGLSHGCQNDWSCRLSET